MSASILLVEDDPRIRRLLEGQLGERSFRVVAVSTGREAILSAAEATPDLILLDYALPDMTGFEVCQEIRAWSETPIILLTVHDEPETKVRVLNAGADDYVTKPFHLPELLARIQAVLRRAEAKPAAEPILEFDTLTVDLAVREVRREGELVRLTRIEFQLLRELALHPDRVLTYEYLLQSVWGAGYEDIRLVHVHVSNLRRKLERGPGGPRYVFSVPGVGYRFHA